LTDSDTFLLQELDRCVKCGLCLPECPTYRLRIDENESPRGRLALIEGLLKGKLTAGPALHRHLDSCLGCRRCERVCPSQARFSLLMDDARSRLPGRMRRLGARLLQRATLQRTATAAGRLVNPLLSQPFRRLHLAHRAARALPMTATSPAPGTQHGDARAAGRVGLFLGCSARALQAATIRSTTRVLQRAGCDVVIPAQDHCCGALAAHAGDPQGAARAAATTRSVFGDSVDTVVSFASGCGVTIDAFDPPLPHSDICHFLLQPGRLDDIEFTPTALTVALHTPCTVENLYRGAGWARTLLQRIPGIDVIEVGTPGDCCGAAGDYMLRHPDTADTLRAPLLTQILASRADAVVTSNIGCALHLAMGLQDAGLAVPVIHPVDLLAQHLA
jgi:glycolate oxidase iron-sulfur subunit